MQSSKEPHLAREPYVPDPWPIPWEAIMELLGPTMGSHYGIIRAYHGKPLWNY